MSNIIVTTSNKTGKLVECAGTLSEMCNIDNIETFVCQNDISEISFHVTSEFCQAEIVELAIAVRLLSLGAPSVKTRLNISQCAIPGSSFVDAQSKAKFGVAADLVNTIGFDRVDLPPVRKEAASLFKGREVNNGVLLINHNWSPEDDHVIDTICFANIETFYETIPNIEQIQDLNWDVFSKQPLYAICASGFVGLEDEAVDSVLYTLEVPQRIGIPPASPTERWEDANVTGKRVLIVVGSYNDIAEVSIHNLASALKNMGAEYVAVYSQQTELTDEERATPIGNDSVDYWFCEYPFPVSNIE